MTVLSPSNQHTARKPVPRFTRRQLFVVRELAQGYDIATVAERRGKGISSTYEIAVRICERVGLSEWQEIGPWAVECGLGDSDGHGHPEH